MATLTQTSNKDFWQDEASSSIPYNRTTTSERIKEKGAAAIHKEAAIINQKLIALKAKWEDITTKVFEAMSIEHKVKIDSKGNFTWYNFNKSIKIEANVNEAIKFDEALIEAAKGVLLTLINDNIKGDDFIISIVNDAFQTSSGSLDTKRILGLKKHTTRIHNIAMREQWQKGMDLIEQSISRPSSKKYMRVYEKDDQGEYQNIQLNFASL